jgi:hypothetical protein
LKQKTDFCIQTLCKGNILKNKRLKIAGSIFLLAAFILQQYLIIKYVSKLENHFKGYQVYSNAYNSSLLYENLFYSQSLATNIEDFNLLKKAAFDNISGLSTKIIYSELDNQEKKENIINLFNIANKIINLKTYNEYKDMLNKIESQYVDKTKNDIGNISKEKDILQWIYFSMYLIGTILLIRAIKYD